MTARYQCLAVCPPGLEEITRRELFSLGINQPRAVPGGVEFVGFLQHIYTVNLHSRTASRVLLRIGSFSASEFFELSNRVGKLHWADFLRFDCPLEIRVTCHKSKLYHSDAVAERVLRAVQAVVPGSHAAQPQETAQLIVVRLENDHVTVSLDSSGEHLHKRGYRQETARAPIRESLAAALLLQAEYQPGLAFYDPLCGAGTFPIEAALLAAKIAPGIRRSFAFQHWQNFEDEIWQTLWQKARDAQIQPLAPIAGSDRDAGAISACLANAARAGVAEFLQFQELPLSAVQLPRQNGLLLANLPYGKRISPAQNLTPLYNTFGRLALQHPQWHCAFLTNNPTLARATRLPLGAPFSFENGGERVGFWVVPFSKSSVQ